MLVEHLTAERKVAGSIPWSRPITQGLENKKKGTPFAKNG